jgi:hypothetical protein
LVFFRDGYLWTGNADGTNRVQIPNSQLYDLNPAWSPDGSKIAFEYAPTGTGIATIRPDGTDRTVLTSGTNDRDPSWSPDGSKLAFARSGIWTMNADGTGQTQVTATGFGPSWSPDGSRIAYVTSDHSLHTVNTDGTGDNLVLDGAVGYEYDGGKTDWQPLPGSSPPPPYEAPKLAAPLRFSLVPVFRQCGTGANPTDGQHSPPLGTPACLPPLAQGVAHFGTQAKGTAWVAVIYGDTNAANGDQADATLRFDLSDIRAAGGADYNPNPSGPDGTLVTRLRFTDRANDPAGTSAGTATDLDLSLPFSCTPTSDPSLGSTCALDSSADAISPGAIKENKATVLQVFRLRLNDSGPNGVRGDSDDRLFATEGVYIP